MWRECDTQKHFSPVSYKKANEECFVVNAAGDTITDYKHDNSECLKTFLAIPERITDISMVKKLIQKNFLPPNIR